MHRRRPLAQRVFRGRSARLFGALLIASAALASGCLVSFDGYQPLGAGGTANGAAGTNGGQSSAGKSSGAAGKASAGNSSGGTSSAGAGATEPVGGEGGDFGGATSGGNAGSAGGGTAGAGGGAASGSGGGGSGGSGGSGPQACPVNLKGPPLVEVPKPGGGIYCMDRTEVTSSDYKLFMDAAVATSGQGLECDWNTTYAPDTSVACTTAQGAYDPVARPKMPVSCVDWCDAKRYCGWAGKRLCGAIAGGANPPASYVDANTDQWYRACSKAGAQKFPYGNAYQPTYCVGLDNSGTHPSQVASAALCIGGYDGLYDMSGNVAEWEDSCSAASGASDNCLTRGGSILSVESVAPSLLCNDSTLNDSTPMPATAKRNSKDELVGFRCCYEP